MPRKRSLILTIAVLALAFLSVKNATACQCSALPTALAQFNASPNVVIVKIISAQESSDRNAVNGLKSATATVGKSYKGNLKVGTELRFAQGGGADCVWTFSDESIGGEFLFYLGDKPGDDGLWYVSGCGRSSSLENAAADLLYLNNLNRARGRTRLSGTVDFNDDEKLLSAGIEIRLRSPRKTYTVRTDPHGVYELYDLPAGNYLVEPEAPQGWSVRWPPKYDNPYQLPEERENPPPPASQVTVVDKQHAELNFSLDPNNSIEGRILSPDGEPIKSVWVYAISPEDPKPSERYPGISGDDGRFQIWNLRPGRHLLVVNPSGRVVAEQPFRTAFYPNVFDRAQATPISIDVGQTVKEITLTIPRFEEVVTISGVLLYANGEPVDDCLVEFREAGQTRPFDEYPTEDTSDEHGRFTIKIIKGATGVVTGILRGGQDDYSDCPELRKFIKRVDNEWVELLTESIAISPDKPLENLIVKFPFSPCNGVPR